MDAQRQAGRPLTAGWKKDLSFLVQIVFSDRIGPKRKVIFESIGHEGHGTSCSFLLEHAINIEFFQVHCVGIVSIFNSLPDYIISTDERNGSCLLNFPRTFHFYPIKSWNLMLHFGLKLSALLFLPMVNKQVGCY